MDLNQGLRYVLIMLYLFLEQFLGFSACNLLDKFDKVIATECLVFAQESLRSKASDKAKLQHVVVSHLFQVYS